MHVHVYFSWLYAYYTCSKLQPAFSLCRHQQSRDLPSQLHVILAQPSLYRLSGPPLPASSGQIERQPMQPIFLMLKP